MKKETIVSLETAKKLKEAGFDIEVIGSYDLASRGQFIPSGTLRKWNYNAHDYTISAPTLKEAVDWLKQKHNIEVEALRDGNESLQGVGCTIIGRPLWNAKISELDKPKAERFGLIWEIYYSEEEALNAAIYKACQIITKNFEIKL